MQDLPNETTSNNNSGGQNPNPFYIDDSTEIDLNSAQEQVTTLKHGNVVVPSQTPASVPATTPIPTPTPVPPPVPVPPTTPAETSIPTVPVEEPEPVITTPMPEPVASPPEFTPSVPQPSVPIQPNAYDTPNATNTIPEELDTAVQENVPDWMQIQPMADTVVPSQDTEEGLLEHGNPFAESPDVNVSEVPPAFQAPAVTGNTTPNSLEGAGSESLGGYAAVESVPEALPSDMAPEVLSMPESAEVQTPSPVSPVQNVVPQAPNTIVPQQMQTSDLQGHLVDKRTSHEQLHEVSGVDPTTQWADEEEEEFIVGVEEAHKH